MTFTFNTVSCGHVYGNCIDRFDLVSIAVPEGNINRCRINNFTTLTNGILHAVIIQNCGYRYNFKAHRCAFRKIAFIRMYADMNTAGCPFKVLCRHGGRLFKHCRIHDMVRKIPTYRWNKYRICTDNRTIRIFPACKAIAFICQCFCPLERSTCRIDINCFRCPAH